MPPLARLGRLPDPVLLPWLPTLITTLRRGGAELAPLLIREAGRIFPGQLPALDAWVPPWRGQPALLGCDDPWAAAEPAPAGAALLGRYPATVLALETPLTRA